MRYGSLFENAESRSEMIATFLALLELIKSKRIRVDGDGDEQTVQMRPQDQWEETIVSETGWDGEEPVEADDTSGEALAVPAGNA